MNGEDEGDVRITTVKIFMFGVVVGLGVCFIIELVFGGR